MNIIENIIKYCEDNQIYDKLSNYGNFYYELKNIQKRNKELQGQNSSLIYDEIQSDNAKYFIEELSYTDNLANSRPKIILQECALKAVWKAEQDMLKKLETLKQNK